MNDLQRAEFYLLKIFINICDKLKIHYYLVCGSALGAVKYQGFIPWDDDIDVALCRPDYEIFIKKAPEMLSESLFLQNYHSEPAFPLIYSKLRNSKTTYIESNSSQLKINHGIFIDIFPLDGYPNNVRTQEKLEKKKRILTLLCYSGIDHAMFSSRMQKVYKIMNIFGVDKHTRYFVSKLDHYLSQWPVENSSIWCNHGNWQGKKEYADRRQYGKGTDAVFEGIKVRIPENYDAYLTQKYGDWRADLPESEKKGHHYYEVCDLSKSYKYYIVK